MNLIDLTTDEIIIFQYLSFNPIFFQDAHIATDTPHNENVENTKPVIELTSDDENMEENELKTTWGKSFSLCIHCFDESACLMYKVMKIIY